MRLLAELASTPTEGIFLNWGFLGIQLGNLIVILSMLALFTVALFVPFPHGRRSK